MWGAALYNAYYKLIRFSQCDVKVLPVNTIMRLYVTACVLFAVLYQTTGQAPQRLSIPGAVLLSQPKARHRAQPFPDVTPIRVRKPFPSAAPSPAPIRPVIEEEYDNIPNQEVSSGFDDEVSKLGISSLQSAVRQAVTEEEPEAVQFRPERPIPILRQNLQDTPRPIARPAPVLGGRPSPLSGARPAPLFRDNVVNTRPAPSRQEIRDEPAPVRRPSPPPQARPQPQEFRQPTRTVQAVRQKSQYLDDDEVERNPNKNRKPPVQILRKYRTDNEDGSITWGFENDDGTFKEETIGVDCITRGKYGYVDPDGVRREYNYETGGRCEDPDEELQEEKKQLVQNQLPIKNPNKIYSRSNTN